MKKFKLFLFVCFIILSNFSITKANSNFTWNNINIDIYYPDKVTYGYKFDVGFHVNFNSPNPYDMMAFIPNIWISNTINISDASWSEIYTSDDIGFHGDFMGPLGDAYSPYTHDANGYNITLYDPYFASYGSNYTWLEEYWNDQVTWTLHDFIIQGDTDFNITLNTEVWDSNSPGTNFIVFDPPAAIASSAVPEPGTIFLFGSGILGMLVLIKRKRI